MISDVFIDLYGDLILGNWSQILVQLEKSYDYELLGMACVWVYYFLLIVPGLFNFLLKLQGVSNKDWMTVNFHS